MKTLLRNIFAQCEQLRFSYEQSQPLFRRAYVDYSTCVSTGLSSRESSGISSQQVLQQNRSAIVGMLEACADANNSRVPEIDQVKVCMVNCLDIIISEGSIGKNESTQQNKESGFSMYFLLVIILVLLLLSLISFAVVKVRKIQRRRTQLLLIATASDSVAKSNGAEESEKTNLSYVERFKKGIVSLNLDRMKNLVKQIREKYPSSVDIKTQVSIEKFEVKKEVQVEIETQNVMRQIDLFGQAGRRRVTPDRLSEEDEQNISLVVTKNEIADTALTKISLPTISARKPRWNLSSSSIHLRRHPSFSKLIDFQTTASEIKETNTPYSTDIRSFDCLEQGLSPSPIFTSYTQLGNDKAVESIDGRRQRNQILGAC